MLNIDSISAICLGAVEGLTEFIPVSSTGHLILAGEMLGLKGAGVDTFEIFIQLGAIFAVVLLYWKRFIAVLDFSARGESLSFSGWAAITRFAVACAPAFLFGWLFSSVIKERLFGPMPVAAAMVVGGIAILLIEKWPTKVRVHRIEELTHFQCLGVGLFQCLALWPGMSRSASTIVGGMILGLERRVAAEFSFLIAVPTIAAASLYSILKVYSSISGSDLGILAVGLMVSFITGFWAIKFFIGILVRHTLIPFGVYRIIAGIAVLWVLWN